METMRARAKTHLPHVLLTLLSIIQALALELFWGELQGMNLFAELSWQSISTGIQVSATFLGILVIWIVYATTVMRFSWVPSIRDSVVPFFVGLLQFILIESLGADQAGTWFFALAVILVVMHGESHLIMRRARQDPDNAEFFQQIAPATFSDALPPVFMTLFLLSFSVYAAFMTANITVVGLGFTASLLLLIWHLVFMGMFWKRTMGELEVPAADPKHADRH